jgi:calcium-translocating P-type ATPase
MVKTFMETGNRHNSNSQPDEEGNNNNSSIDPSSTMQTLNEDTSLDDNTDPSTVLEIDTGKADDGDAKLTPRFGGLAMIIDGSLRSIQSASSALLHMTFHKGGSEHDTPFAVSAKDLSELCAERTHQALARLLNKAASNMPQGTLEEEESLKNNRSQIEALVKRIGVQDDDEDRRKSLALAGEDTNEAVQRRHDMEMAANALATVVLRSKPEEGISNEASDIEFRRTTFGTNAIAEKKLDSFLKLCWNAVQDFVLLMLIALGVVGILVETTIGLDPGEQCGLCWLEGAAILVSVCIVVLVTAGIDYAKQFAFVRLTRSLNETNTKMVIRDGQQLSVTDDEIVVGDILSVNAHNLASIPADCVVLGPHSGLKMDESALTGESVLISKNPGDIVLSGTTAIQGSAKMVVIAVGTNSVAGKIQAHVYESSDHDNSGLDGDEDSPLFVKLEKIAKQIGIAGTCAAALSLAVNCIKGFAFGDEDPKEALIEYFVTAITVLAVAVPEGLPLAVTLALAYSSNKMMKEQNLVKHLDACETMGCATTICTDKVS